MKKSNRRIVLNIWALVLPPNNHLERKLRKVEKRQRWRTTLKIITSLGSPSGNHPRRKCELRKGEKEEWRGFENCSES